MEKLHSNNWFQILDELKRAGISNAEVARRLNVTPPAVDRWKSGGEPSHYYGELILALYKRHCVQRMPANIATSVLM